VTFDEIKAQAISEWEALEHSDKPRILIGTATCGRAAGAIAVLEAINSELARHNIKAIVTPVGCIGLCYAEPLVNIVKPGRPHIYYGNITPELAAQLIEDYLIKDNPRPDLALGTVGDISVEDIPKLFELPMLKPQVRIVLRNCGIIDPENINHYIARDGYSGLVRALGMTPEEVIEEIKKSGLRGRGGAAFPTGLKWEFCHNAPGTVKYLICNAAEGDPGIFKDRSLLEGDPHAILEGILIGAYAMGATEGYIFVRGEYELAIERLKLALRQMADYGLVGDNILGSDFSFHLKIKQGAGAFVCGEETALMEFIEGKRSIPRFRPPFPAQAGLWGKPTNINNVETLANVSAILQGGAEWYAGYGSERSKGTKTFALSGKIERTGLIEVPMGIPLQEIIYSIGGGIPDGKRFKAVQLGGPAGGCLPASLLNLPVDYEALTQASSSVGSGGIVVMDEDTCIVDVARYFFSFTQEESCGKCIPCRLGTKQMLNILEDITSGKGKLEDIDLLLNLGEQVKAGSLCGLGQTAPNPVLTTIRYFRHEYEEHIKRNHCQAAVCPGLVRAPCSHTCPAGVDAPRYIRFIAEGKFAEAVAVIREKIPFPSVCGYVCVHPCEAKCRRALLDEAIGIRVLKRFATEHDTGLWKLNSKVAPATGKRVAIIGSGPTGLTAAYYLAKLGHPVTVFEALPQPGGMMRVGIPDYRLPKDILRAEIEEIESIGVEIRTNTRVDSLDGLFKQGYNAIFLAIGAHQGIKVGVEGEDSPRVWECVSFLRDVNLGKEVKLGDRVAVIGGSNAAIGSARTALRLGAKEVAIVYRRTRTEMPASAEEIDEAIAEGVKVRFLAAPSRIISRNGELELECVGMRLGAVDTSGRRRPEPIEGSEFVMSFDTIIAAIGQRPEIPGRFNLPIGRGNTIQVDPDTLATSREGVFAGGDAISGPASVIEAIADGRQAAISIDKYLGGSGEIDETLAPPEEEVAPQEETVEGQRTEVPTIPVAERLKGFSQVELGLSEEMAIREAERCLRCDLEERE